MNDWIWAAAIAFMLGVFIGFVMGVYYMDAPLTGVCG